MAEQSNTRKALLGFHHSGMAMAGACMLRKQGYDVDVVDNYDEMVTKAQRNGYDLYVMHLNLGTPGSKDISAGLEVFSLVQDRIKQGLVKFVGVSGHDANIAKANENGIPAVETSDLPTFKRMIS